MAIEEYVFPLFTFLPRHGLRCLGTAFFIEPHGGFITAKHVLPTTSEGQTYLTYGVQTLHSGDQLIRRVHHFSPHAEADVVLGMLGEVRDYNNQIVQGNPPLAPTFEVSLHGFNIGDRIRSFGYPTQDIDDGDGGDEVGVTFQGQWTEGEILEVCPEGSMLVRTPCYKTSMPLLHGQSGGPVLIGDRIVAGLNNAGEEGNTPSYISSLDYILDLDVYWNGQLVSFRQIAANGGQHAFNNQTPTS